MAAEDDQPPKQSRRWIPGTSQPLQLVISLLVVLIVLPRLFDLLVREGLVAAEDFDILMKIAVPVALATVLWACSSDRGR